MRWGILLTVVVVCQMAGTAQETRPLPESASFLAAVRENLARSEAEQHRFAYRERRTTLRMNPFGRMGTGAIRVYDVAPSDDGTMVSRRLIEEAGAPVTGAKVEWREARGRERESQDARRTVEDVVDALQFTIDRRETVGGRPAIVVTFEARSGAKPQTRQGRMARAFTGSIWIDEGLMEVRKVEAVAVDTISVGFGFLARLHEGAEVAMTREPVSGSLWLPTSIRFVGTGRAMLFRKLEIDHVTDWFDYREVVR